MHQQTIIRTNNQLLIYETFQYILAIVRTWKVHVCHAAFLISYATNIIFDVTQNTCME
jgi:hypothetical protein